MILMNVVEDEMPPSDGFISERSLWLASIFFTIDWTSEAASLHVRETSWLLAIASFSAQLLITLLSISR